jgi:hypothetical protein
MTTGSGLARRTIRDHPADSIEVGPDAVHLVDEGDARHAVLVGLAPNGLGLRLDSAYGAEHRDGAVENAKRTLDLGGEVHVPGRVDDVDPVVVPVARRRGGGDRDAALLAPGPSNPWRPCRRAPSPNLCVMPV